MTRLMCAALLVCASVNGAYQYYQSDSFSSIDSSKWTQNGSLSAGAGLTTSTSGSLISKLSVPDGSDEYEVQTSINPGAAASIHYLRATNDALYSPSQGTYYSTEVEYSGGYTTLRVYKRSGGFKSMLGSVSVYSGATTVRSVIRNEGSSAKIRVYYSVSSASPVIEVVDSSPITGGKPGIGLYQSGSGNIVSAQIGPLDRTAPASISSTSVQHTTTPIQTCFQWSAASDDPDGIGVVQYRIHRDGYFINETTQTNFCDSTASATQYNYSFYTADYHGNLSGPTGLVVTTTAMGQAAGTLPWRAGVKPLGAYWGAGGEQIDTLTGNLNWTLPLLKAMGRTGWGAEFALSYNSQIWRKDSGGETMLGKDVGYGFGWQLMAGSLTPYWSNTYTLAYYIYRDVSGAEYRLYQTGGGTWDGVYQAKDGVYLAYQRGTGTLHFPDGSFWYMGCTAASGEPNEGTMYPTVMQDSDGNQIEVRYNAGIYAGWADSSARISEIEDVRAQWSGTSYRTYWFTYASGRLVYIQNSISTEESYSFTYGTGALLSPFPPNASYPGVTRLLSVTNPRGLAHSFEYNNNGEMTRATLPFGGSTRWDYRSFTFSGNKTVREISNRYLRKSIGAPETTYAFVRDDVADASKVVHGYTCINDPSGIGQKCWNFDTAAASAYVGLAISQEDKASAGGSVLQRQEFTWTQDYMGSMYIGTVLSTLDPGAAFQKQSKTQQTLDIWGNVTQTKIFEFGNLTTPARTYNNSYLWGGQYAARYILNRLLTSSVTNGTTTIQLVSNTYDGASYLTDRPGVLQHDYLNYGPTMIWRGHLTTSVIPGKTLNTSYDITGAVVSGNDGQGHTVSVTPAGGTNYSAPGVITVNNAYSQTLTYNSSHSVTSSTAPNSAIQSTVYDGYGAPTSTTSVHGAVTTYEYVLLSEPRSATVRTNGKWVKTTFDGLGRAIKVETGHGTGAQQVTVSITDTEYDSCSCSPVGKTKRTTLPYAPGETPQWTVSNYDGLGRTVSVALPGGSGSTTYLYQGNETTVTDPAGKWKKFTKSALGNLTQVNEPNPAGGADLITTYTYDILNHLTGVSMTRGAVTQTRSFVYNSDQRLQSFTHPESGTTTFTYHADGTLASRTDAKGQKTEYSYHATKQQLLEVRRYPMPGVEDLCQRTSFLYDSDPSSGGFSQNGSGRLVRTQWGSPTCAGGYQFTEMYSYTPGGLITAKRLRVNSTDLTATYGYDNEGKVLNIGYPSYHVNNGGIWSTVAGGTLTYTYDVMARPIKLTDNDPTRAVDWVKDLVYDTGGQITQIRYLATKGATAAQDVYYLETLAYNHLRQLTRMTTTNQSTSTAIMDMEYRFSAAQNNGRITQHKDWVTGEEVTYQYDSLQRLISAATTGPEWGLSFGYDGFGNRLSQSVTKGAAPTSLFNYDATNRISSPGYSFDLNGNMTAMPGQTGLTYDVENRLKTASGDQYAYAPDNKRIWKKRPDGTEDIYFYGALGEKLGTYRPVPGGGSTVYMTLVGTSTYFGGKLIRENGTVVVLDRQGSNRTAGSSFFPHGEEQAPTASDRHKYASYHRDQTTGLDYAVNRYYPSGQGRFLTPDPYQQSGIASNPASWNRYSYALGDPVNGVDPDGLLTLIIGGRSFVPWGTSDATWGQPGTAFNAAVSNYFKEQALVYTWRGQTYEIHNGAVSLLNLIKMLKTLQSMGSLRGLNLSTLNVVGFSDGGNVAKRYTNLAGAQRIDTLITLGTPHRFDFPVNGPMVGNYFNVYSKWDQFQEQGGPYYMWAPTVVGSTWVWRTWGWQWGIASIVTGWFVGTSGRTDRCAVNIGIDSAPGISRVGHFDLYSPQVWFEMQRWLVRAGHGLSPSNLSYCRGGGGGIGGGPISDLAPPGLMNN